MNKTKFTLDPGAKATLKIKKASSKAQELQKINDQLSKITGLSKVLNSKGSVSKTVQAQIQSLSVAGQDEIENQKKLVQQLSIEPLIPYLDVIKKECSQILTIYRSTKQGTLKLS